MADLFLSYAHQDVERAEALARFLEANGLTVWWDRRMVAGDKIHDVIDEEIEKAKAVIVLWSSISVKSDWVRGEAQTAHELAKLVPIKIAECKLPINYRGIHTPEVYKSKAERDKLAQMLSDKFKTAQPLLGGTTAQLPRGPTAALRPK
jgi:adenylate cyclase